MGTRAHFFVSARWRRAVGRTAALAFWAGAWAGEAATPAAAAPPAAHHSGNPHSAAPARPGAAGTEAAAIARAVVTNTVVPITSMTTQTQVAVANPDGSVTA